MQRAVSACWSSVALLTFFLQGFAWGQYLPVPGPGPIAPAPDFSESFPDANETHKPPPPRGYAEDIRRAKQEATSEVGKAPGRVQYEQEGSAERGWPQLRGQFIIEEQEGEPQPSAPALITNFNGIGYTFSIPPDPVLAAGPNYLLLATNGSVTIRDKTGTLVASTTLRGFFNSVRAGGEVVFDPKVLFDTGSNRFFLAAVGLIENPSCTPGTCVSHFFLAVSKTSSPTTVGSGDWYFYAFDATLDGSTATTNSADYTGLGVDSNVVVLTANMFSFSTETFQWAKIRILDKSVLITGGAVTWTDFVGMADPGTSFKSFTLQPAQTFGSPGTFFLVSASKTSGSCDIVVWGIANPLSSPTLSSLKATAGGTCTNPPNALQSGGGIPLDTGDRRLMNAVYRNGSLWTAHAIQMNFGSQNVSAIRWVQINVDAWPNSVSRTQDLTFGADGIWYFYPTLMVDTSNNIAIVLSRSSASEYGSAYYTGRLSTDSLNTLQPSALLKTGAANYLNLDSVGFNRWGDYLGISLDPSDGSFWILGEYAATSSTWGTWVGNFSASNPVPTLSSISPSSATAGGAGFTLTVTGTNFIVSSVVRWNGGSRTTTYVSSTQLQATISASDIATTGTAQVTVFNPAAGGGTSNALTFTIIAGLTLTVAKAGTGSGTVISFPTGISCGADCSESYTSGSSVLLSASPAADSLFLGWSGGGCSGTGTCTVTVTANTTVTATFFNPAVFTDATLTARSTVIKALHFAELRAAINRLRTRYGLATFAFTDPTLTPGSTSVKRVHLTELRTALSGVYTAAGRTQPTYSEVSIVAAQTSIKASHLSELRSAVRALE